MLTRILQSFLAVCLLCFAGTAMSAVSAESTEPVLVGDNDKDAYVGIPAIKFTVSDMELGKVAQFIASLSKTKIEIDPNIVHSKVTFDFKGDPFADVMANLARQVRGEVFWIDGKPKRFYLKPQPLNSGKPK